MTKYQLGLIAVAANLALAAPGQAQSAGESVEGIEKCRNIANASERLDCYDRVHELEDAAGPVPSTPASTREGSGSETTGATASSPDKEVSDVAADQPEYGVLTDDTGMTKPDDAYKPIPVTITRCGQANNRKWYFYLDNGQVWQYLGARTLRYKSCDTPGQLTEDRLGFSLQMNGNTAKHRVRRVR